ncbi:hypothetical protein M9H77_27990 [Catharanthus roseus]|uniref:Uncharacterized protein n=1 Tax=Catharanthus roseus TaxID=4058 RepID=A0ACC0AFJ2_CATRO|nr:hypothetical protein M9H77_27990 [Catharanthus roseus]
MVHPSGRRGDDDLSPVTDRTGRVQGRTVTALSRGVRERHSTSDLPSTPTPLPAGFYHDTGAPWSSTQPPLVHFRSRPPHSSHFSHTPVPYEAYGSAYPHSSHHPDYGVSPSEPFIGRRHSADLGAEADRGGVLCPAVIELHVIYSTCWVALCSLQEWQHSSFQILALGEGCEIGWEVCLGCCDASIYVQKSWSCLTRGCKGVSWVLVTAGGYKIEHKLLDIRLWLDMMSAEEVRWMLYGLQEIRDCWVSTWHGFIAVFDVVEPYMPDRALLDLIARKARREDAGKKEKFDRIVDLLSRHYRGTY